MLGDHAALLRGVGGIGCVKVGLTQTAENGKAGGDRPRRLQTEGERKMLNLIFLLLIVVIIGRKVKITIEMR
jgi:hypothetical protein